MNFGNFNQEPAQGVLCLEKGGLLDLTKMQASLKKVVAGCGWRTLSDNTDLDLTVMMTGANGKIDLTKIKTVENARHEKITVPARVCYFVNPDCSDEGVKSLGDARSGSGKGDDEQIQVNLDLVPADVESLYFVVNIFESDIRKKTFKTVRDAYIRLVDEDTEKELCRYNLTDDYQFDTAIIVGRMVRNGRDWSFEAIGEGMVVKDLNEVLIKGNFI